jgi:hypothetical protein
MDQIAELSSHLSPLDISSEMLQLMKVQLQLEVPKMSSVITSNQIDENLPVEAISQPISEVEQSCTEPFQNVSNMSKKN